MHNLETLCDWTCAGAGLCSGFYPQASLHFGRDKPRRQLKRVARPEEASAGADNDASDEESDLPKSRPAVNIGHLSGLGASLEGEHCFRVALRRLAQPKRSWQ